MMRYQIIPPPPILKDHVKYFWHVHYDEASAQPMAISTLVDDSTGLIIQHHEGKSACRINDNPLPPCILYGQTTRPSLSECLPSFSATGVLFYPCALRELFGIDALHFTNQMLEPEAMGEAGLTDRLLNESHDQQRKLITDFLIRKLMTTRPVLDKREDKAVKACLQYIASLEGKIRVNALEALTHMSERQLERRFRTAVGVTPRHWLKVVRFRRALELLKSGSEDKLSDVAYAAGYADQAHFNRHVKELSGLTPKLLRDRLNGAPVNLIA